MKKLILIAAIALASCKAATFTMMSTKQVDMSKQYTLKKSAAVGKGLDMQTAVDNCINSAGGVYITNVVIYEGLFRYKVVGDVYGNQ